MKLRNENFAIALDWLVKNKGVDGQKGLAQITGISQNTISRIMTGKVEPSDDTLRKLNDAFEGIFNMNFLRGSSIVMLAEDKLYYSQHPEEHPLYEPEETVKQLPDMSSVFNAALAAKDIAIESLRRELDTKDELNKTLREQVQLLKTRIADLERQLAASATSDLSHYPFPIGAAEDHKTRKSL